MGNGYRYLQRYFSGSESDRPTSLTYCKSLSFSLAYCDNDEGYTNADVFETLELAK